MLGEGGEAPLIGDLDDSHILPMLGSKNYIHSMAQSVASYLNEPVPFEPQADLRLKMLGLSVPSQEESGLQNHFEHGGITQLTKGDVRVLIDHGALGYDRLAAHGHADALSVQHEQQKIQWRCHTMQPPIQQASREDLKRRLSSPNLMCLWVATLLTAPS